MKKLLVICGAGMTSSVLVSSMREAASKLPETEYRIGSCSLAQIEKYVPQADIVFLAPHLSYMEKDMRRKYPETPVFLIPAGSIVKVLCAAACFYSAPFVERSPMIRGSVCVASSSARANDLKSASIL